jgi:hypothetical protein
VSASVTVDEVAAYCHRLRLPMEARGMVLALWHVRDRVPYMNATEVGRLCGMCPKTARKYLDVLKAAGFYTAPPPTRTRGTGWHHDREITLRPGRFERLPASRPRAATRGAVKNGHVIRKRFFLKELTPPTPLGGVAGGPPGPDTPARPAAAPARALRPPGRPGRTRRQPRTPAPPPPPEAAAVAAAVQVPGAARAVAVALAAGWPAARLRAELDGVHLGDRPAGLAAWRIGRLMAGPPPPPAPRQRVRAVPHCGSPLCRAGTRKIIDYDTGAELGDCPVCSPYVAVAQHTVSVSGQALRAGPNPVTVAKYPVLSTAYRTAKEHPHGRTV